jgi:ubiquitin carboxyl-terminal hydrolase 5/13
MTSPIEATLQLEILVPVVDRDSLQQLLSMGFSETRSRKALLATNNSGAEIAMEWLLEHLEDPGR